MTTTLLDATPRASYRARRQPDGSVTVEDVPVFAEIRDGEHPGRAPRPAAWLAKAVERSQERKRLSGYLPPLHFRHHDGVSEVEPAGTLEPTRIGALAINPGEGPRPVVFATLRFRNEAAFQRWLDHYPNRSIEISSDHPEEINSLALLDSEAPLDRFPPTSRANVELASARRELAQIWRHAAMEDMKPDEGDDTENAAAEVPATGHHEPDGDEAKEPTMKEVLAAMAAGFADLKKCMAQPAMPAQPAMAAYAASASPTQAEPVVMAAKVEAAAATLDPASVGRIAALEEGLAEVKNERAREAARARLAATWRAHFGRPATAKQQERFAAIVAQGPGAVESFAATIPEIPVSRAEPLAAPAFGGYGRPAAEGPAVDAGVPAPFREVFSAALKEGGARGAAAVAAMVYAKRGAYAGHSPDQVKAVIDGYAAQLVAEKGN